MIPGTAILLTALSFNLFGVWLRAVSDPLQRWRWLKANKGAKEAGVTSRLVVDADDYGKAPLD